MIVFELSVIELRKNMYRKGSKQEREKTVTKLCVCNKISYVRICK